MIWLAWRQHRKQLLFAIIGLAVIAALIVPTGRAMHQAFVDTGLAECVRTGAEAPTRPTGAGPVQSCDTIANNFSNRYFSMLFLAILFVSLPLLVGLFWGAPMMAREVEHGTHRLIWTQGVTRRRWALVKVLVVGTSALTLAVAYAVLITWWLGPISATTSRLAFLVFDLQGLVPVAYTLFAVALGAFLGTFARRSLPAMALTLVSFIAVRAAVGVLGRPNYQTPKQQRFPVVNGKQPESIAGDWTISTGLYNASGKQLISGGTATCDGPPPTAVPSASPQVACDVTGGYGAGAYNQRVYQPADRFWPFQYIETGIFVSLALLLIALAVWRIRRHLN